MATDSAALPVGTRPGPDQTGPGAQFHSAARPDRKTPWQVTPHHGVPAIGRLRVPPSQCGLLLRFGFRACERDERRDSEKQSRQGESTGAGDACNRDSDQDCVQPFLAGIAQKISDHILHSAGWHRIDR